jgi:hypothetical protein
MAQTGSAHHRYIHGETRTPLYRVWAKMRERCGRPNDAKYPLYGGRGISVCPEWLDFITFSAWAHDNGYQQGLSIDRVDNNGNYEPSNCRWATQKEQQRNRVDNRVVIRSDGKTYGNMADAAEDTGNRASKQNIWHACQKAGRTSGGYGWRYATEAVSASDRTAAAIHQATTQVPWSVLD